MLVILAKLLIPFLVIFNIIPLLIWVERKGSAFIQDRHGPNRASLFGIRAGGLLHSLSDVIKLLTKEDIVPHHVNKPFYILAPFITLMLACVTYAVIPFGDDLMINGEPFYLQTAKLDVGILYIMAMSSLAVFGVMLAGWASNNKYALLGGVRSSAQMISYEISLGLSILCVILVSGSFDLNEIARHQTHLPWNWNFLKMFPVWMIFTICAFAECNRAPFDLPEGESEIVAGYHVEYSSMKFAMFFMAEYAHMIIASALISLLFFGGWQVPFLSTETLREYSGIGLFVVLVAHAVLFALIGILLLRKYKKGKYGDKRDYEVLIFGFPFIFLGLVLGIFALIGFPFNLGELGSQVFTAFIQFGAFIFKVLSFCWLFIWVRWTLPRFRYDQLMRVGWKGLLPLSLGCVVITGIVVYFVN